MSSSEFYREQNERIIHANDAYTALVLRGRVTGELLLAAQELIEAEQYDAISRLQEQYEIDRENSERIPHEVSERLAQIAILLEDLTAKHDEQQAGLRAIGEYYPKEISGLSLTDYASQISTLSDEKTRLMAAPLELPYEGNEHLYAAWTIPVRSMPDHDVAFEYPQYLDWDTKDASRSEFIDVFPDDMTASGNEDVGVIERARRNCTNRKLDASEQLAIIVALEGELGKVWTLDELASKLYQDDLDTVDHRKSKVGALLSNMRLLKTWTIQDTLAADNPDWYLQLGKRYDVDEHGELYGRGTTVCRLINLTEEANRQDHNYADPSFVWDGDDLADPIVELTDSLKQDSTPVEQVGQKPVASEFNGKKDRFEKMLSSAEPWLSYIVAAEGKGLTLMQIAETAGSVSHGVVGTPENLRRAWSAKIISTAERDTGIVKQPAAAVATAIINGHRAVFSNKNSRARALELLEDAVKFYKQSLKKEK